MKAKTLCLLAGTAVPLILTGSVQAEFTGLSTFSKPNEFGLLVVNVYAEFDRPGDLMQTVGGTASTPLVVTVENGTFYNHSFGSVTNASPNAALIDAFPSLAFDSFVSIGAKFSSAAFPDETTLFGLPPIAGSVFSSTGSGWGVTPLDPQGDPFNTDYSSGNGQILIGQFATIDGTAIHGMMAIHVVSNDAVRQLAVSFYHVPGPSALWLLGAAGLLGSRRRYARGAAP